MARRLRLLSLSWITFLPAFAVSSDFAGRTDVPPMPKGEYTWEEPKDWTPPSLEELQKWEWKPGRVTNGTEIANARYAEVKATLSDDAALTLKNDSKEANDKILATLGRPPKDDSEVDWDATINRHLHGAPETMNPLLASSSAEQDIIAPINGGMFSFDHLMKPFADNGTVREWKVNPMADMIILRDDITWEDGTPFTAYDVEFSYHVIMDMRINIPAVRSGTDELKWVKAYDKNTLVIFHKDALVTNVWNVNFPVIPKHIYSPGLVEDPTMRSSKWNVYWNLHPLSANAYKLKEHQTNQYVLFERREDWHQDKDGKRIREKPYSKFLRFRIIPDDTGALLAFKKGELDELRLNARQWNKETDDAEFKQHGVKVNGEEWIYNFIGWNQKPIPDAPFFKDKRVREAMAYAFNHQEYLEKLCFGLYDPMTGPFHPSSWMHNASNKPYQQDLDKAEELLEAAGWLDSDGDGVRDKEIDGKKWKFEFTLSVSQGGTGEQLATLLKQDLDAIGIVMNIKVLEWATFMQQTHEKRFEAASMAWGTGTDPDTAKNIWTTKAQDDGRNEYGYSNPRVDELFEQGAREFDPEKRKAIYQEIDKLIYEDQPYTFTAARRSLWAFNKKLRGYAFSPRDPISYTPGSAAFWVPKK